MVFIDARLGARSEYSGHYVPKRVTNAGTIRFKKRLLFIANSLKQQVVGLETAIVPGRLPNPGVVSGKVLVHRNEEDCKKR